MNEANSNNYNGSCDCGCKDKILTPYAYGTSYILTLILCFLVGMLGMHRFYTGKIKSGLVMLILTFTIIGTIITILWAIFDFFCILFHSFDTMDGRPLE